MIDRAGDKNDRFLNFRVSAELLACETQRSLDVVSGTFIFSAETHTHAMSEQMQLSEVTSSAEIFELSLNRPLDILGRSPTEERDERLRRKQLPVRQEVELRLGLLISDAVFMAKRDRFNSVIVDIDVGNGEAVIFRE
ncbi:MAG: hypothetical protein AAF919_02055 [Pseudomonadota bacterium]